MIKGPIHVSSYQLTYKQNKFYIGDEPIQFISGAIHYFRIVPEDWYDRLYEGEITGDTIYQLALNGEEEAIHIYHEVGQALGIGLISLVHLLNPKKIVLGGGVMRAERYILPVMKQMILEKALTGKAKNTMVEVSRWKTDATLKGAIAIVLEQIFHTVVEDEMLK